MQPPHKNPTVVPLVFWAQVHQRGKSDSRYLLNQTASIAVNITEEVNENVCVAICDYLAAKCLLQTEVEASKTTQTCWIGVPQAHTRF